MTKGLLLPPLAFLIGSTLMASLYLGILIWLQGWNYAASQFVRDRWYVLPINSGFGVQAAIYSVLRFRFFIPLTTTGDSGAIMGTSGTTSATTMVACCQHHVTEVLPILWLSAAASFLTRFQRPFMLVGLGMHSIGILVMLVVLSRERLKILALQSVLECLDRGAADDVLAGSFEVDHAGDIFTRDRLAPVK